MGGWDSADKDKVNGDSISNVKCLLCQRQSAFSDTAESCKYPRSDHLHQILISGPLANASWRNLNRCVYED